MKRLLISAFAALAAAAPSAVAQYNTTAGGGTRVDFYDHTGKILHSHYPEQGTVPFSMYRSSDSDLWEVNGSWTMEGMSSISDIRFVRWGQESYPVTVETDSKTPGQPEIKVSYEIVTEDANGRRVPTRAEEGDVKCGSLMRLRIEVPEGYYPVVGYHEEMTGYNLDEALWSYNYAFGPANFVRNNYVAFYNRGVYISSWREFLNNMYGGYGAFSPVEGEPGVWTLDFSMPNEPITLRVSAEKPSSEILKAIETIAMRSLYTQYQDVSFNAPQANGEPYIMQAVGDAFSQDLISGLAMKANFGWELLKKSNLVLQATPWEICFSSVALANFVISQLDRFEGNVTSDEIDVVRARMLVLRSHAYWRLLQIYGSRWQDSNGGEAYCVPLETTFAAEHQPLAKMKDILAQCYADLDQAIAVFTRIPAVSSDILMPGLDVARAVKMRLAMLREDWSTARDLAAAIMTGKTLSTPDDLKAGFFTPTRSWLWGATNGYEIMPGGGETGLYSALYYWAAQSFNTCNGVYPANWQYAPGAIDKDLYLSIPETDMRRRLFAMPDYRNDSPELPTWNDWYNPDNVDSQILTYLRGGSWQSGSSLFASILASAKPTGATDPAFASSGSSSINYIPVQFGAQVKFYASQPTYSLTDAVVFLRVEEVLLSQAEAAYRLGDENMARQLLISLNISRDPSYSCTASGEALLQEIQRYRRIELWGEGHSWFDYKRWNLPIERRMYERNVTSSGNWPSSMSGTVSTSDINGWRYPIPAYAVKENTRIDVSLMNYQGVEYPAAQGNVTSRTSSLRPLPGASAVPVREIVKEPSRSLLAE